MRMHLEDFRFEMHHDLVALRSNTMALTEKQDDDLISDVSLKSYECRMEVYRSPSFTP